MEKYQSKLVVPKRYYFYIFFLALFFRLCFLFLIQWDNHIIDSYDEIAINLIEGKGFSYNGVDPTVCRAPAYPAYLAILFLVFGHEPEPFLILRIFDIFLDSLIALFVLWISSL